MTTDRKTSFAGEAAAIAQRSTERGLGQAHPSTIDAASAKGGGTEPLNTTRASADGPASPIAGLPRIASHSTPNASSRAASAPRSVAQVPRPAASASKVAPADAPQSRESTVPAAAATSTVEAPRARQESGTNHIPRSDASSSPVTTCEPPPLDETQNETLDAYPAELVNSEISSPRVYLYASSGVRVQLNSVTEAPPPVQITYAPGPTRAIPYRFAAPLAIIVFAAGAMLVLLVARGNGTGANSADPRDAAGSDPVQASHSVIAPLAGSRHDANADANVQLQPDPALAAEATSVKADSATTVDSALPVILMDIPADDPMVLRALARKADLAKSGRKKAAPAAPSSGKSRPRFDNPD